MAELVAQKLRTRIIRGELVEGEALPPEAQLMEQFGVSRPTLREAFRVLESESLISIRRGSRGGARVCAPDIAVAARYTAILLHIRHTTVNDVYDTRLILEPAAARRIAEVEDNGSAISQLRAAVDDELTAVEDRIAHAAASTRFHELLMELSGSNTLAVLCGMLHEIVDEHLAQMIAASVDEQSANLSKATRMTAIKAHTKLVSILESGDGESAETFWRLHMEAARLLVLRGIGPQALVDAT